MNAIPDTWIFVVGAVIYAFFIGATWMEFRKAADKLDNKSR